MLTDALIDSRTMRDKPESARRLSLDRPLPIDLTEIADAQQVRRWIARAQRAYGRNETRQLRLVFEGIDAFDREDLMARLAGRPRK